MEIEVWSVGKAKFTADPEFQEPVIREAIDTRGDVASAVLDYTDSERSDISHDEYARVTGDVPGLVLFEGWLTGDRNAPPPSIAGAEADVDALARRVQQAWNEAFTHAPDSGLDYRMARVAAETVLAVHRGHLAGENGSSFPGPEDDPAGSYE